MNSLHDYPDTQLFIGGNWLTNRERDPAAVLDPATGLRIGSVELAGEPQLEQAVAAAVAGFHAWQDMALSERCRILAGAAALLRQRADEIGHLMTQEQGKRLSEARMEVSTAAEIVDWCSEEARRSYGRYVPSRTGKQEQLVIREAVGPVAAFTPWNFPVNQAVRKIAPALAAGCSIVLKGPEEAPASVAALVRAFDEAGVPPGTLNLVYGVPAEISTFLIKHPAIRKISFTGSTRVGKQLASLAGSYMKRVTMELGGHAPVIVCKDADIALSVKLMIVQKFWNAGQTCISPTRFLVQENIYESYLAQFTKAAQALKVGSGLDPDTRMGPMANQRRVDAIAELVDEAVSQGATTRIGGARIKGPGFFFEPTVMENVSPDSRLMNEEPFGPVACFSRFSTLAKAIEEANRLPYGLAAYAFTESAADQARLMHGIHSGMVAINSISLGLPELPFGGVNDSGYGSEGGQEAIDAYQNIKLVSIGRR